MCRLFIINYYKMIRIRYCCKEFGEKEFCKCIKLICLIYQTLKVLFVAICFIAEATVSRPVSVCLYEWTRTPYFLYNIYNILNVCCSVLCSTIGKAHALRSLGRQLVWYLVADLFLLFFPPLIFFLLLYFFPCFFFLPLFLL